MEKEARKKAPRADMTESKPWRPNILPLLCRIEPTSSSKVPGQLALPFEQVLSEAVLQNVLEAQDSNAMPKQLTELYQLRWQATEVNFKHLKTTLTMEMIGAKTPRWCKRSVQMLAYNLLLTLMWQSAQQAGVLPLRISLRRQQFNQFRANLVQATAESVIGSIP